MPSLLRLTLVALWLAAPTIAAAIDQVPWAPTLAEAQKSAGEQGKLVLVHFYNDHCPPCERVEQEVFSQPAVGQAIARNYVPVKVHAGDEPMVAEHYRVDRWPTDIICTPAGLEIMRTTSPQKAEAYLNLVNQVALQAGVGAGRQWAASMQTAGHEVLDPHVAQAQAVAGDATQAAQGYANQAQAAAQGYGNRATATFEAYAAQANRWNQQANAAAQQAGNSAQQLGNNAQQLGNTAQQFGSQLQQTGQELRTSWNAGAAAAMSPPAGDGPAGSAYAQFAQPQAGTGPAPSAAPGPATSVPPAPQLSVSPALPSLPTANPFITQQPAAATPPTVGAPPTGATAATLPAPVPTTSNVPAAAPSTSAVPPSAAIGAPPLGGQANSGHQPASNIANSANSGPVPASQAPPIALEGYCPVTLLEQGKWKRSNPQFGAIHRGRTYLFASEVEQKKFLADPETFSPMLSGYDPVVFSQRGEMVEGKRSYGVKYQNQVFLFADESSLQAFSRSPHAFADQARQAMHRAAAGSRLR